MVRNGKENLHDESILKNYICRYTANILPVRKVLRQGSFTCPCRYADCRRFLCSRCQCR